MKAVGIRKEIDRFGRLVIPKEIREMYHLGSEAEILLTTDGVLIRPVGCEPMVDIHEEGEDILKS